MNKTIIAMLIFIVILTGIIVGINTYEKQQYANRQENVQTKNEVEQIASIDEEIYDDCTDEWENMNDEKSESETLQVNSGYEKEEKTKFVLKDKYGKITIYKVDDNGEEEEYDITDIATDYLAEEDKQNLRNGITVSGEEALNQLLEDFE